MDILKRVALILLIIGGINWGLIGLFQFDLVAAIFGDQNAVLSRVIYTLVGISALISLAILFDPMPDTGVEGDEQRPIRTDKPNYSMEFGDEPDFNSNPSDEDKR